MNYRYHRKCGNGPARTVSNLFGGFALRSSFLTYNLLLFFFFHVFIVVVGVSYSDAVLIRSTVQQLIRDLVLDGAGDIYDVYDK